MAEAKTTADEARVVDETEVDKLGTNHLKEREEKVEGKQEEMEG